MNQRAQELHLGLSRECDAFEALVEPSSGDALSRTDSPTHTGGVASSSSNSTTLSCSPDGP